LPSGFDLRIYDGLILFLERKAGVVAGQASFPA
jgi:hypothetical protein